MALNPGKSPKIKSAMSDVFRDPLFLSIDTLSDLTDQILKSNCKKLSKSAAAIRKTPDPEAVHEMRVATRKLRAAIKTFKSILPSKAQKIRLGLRKLGRILGQKRDLDVFSDFIRLTVGIDPLSIPNLALQLDQSRKRLLSTLDSKFYEKLIASLKKLKAHPSKKSLFKFSRRRIGKTLKKVLKVAPSVRSDLRNPILHRLRIAIKNLRYVCEFFEPICSASFVEKTRKIQDTLGQHQDAISGIVRLIRYKNEFPLNLFFRIKRTYVKLGLESRKAFLRLWKGYL